MCAKAFYNLKLAAAVSDKSQTIVSNDLKFDGQHLVYVLTGANRGGKTTVTQAVGLLFALAQGGIFVPAETFSFHPVDSIYTHFPADEDKTMDLGRLGEECRRFREIYADSTKNSLLLLNETFSTTSFEEGYFIAKDAVRAVSLIVRADVGNRLFQIAIAPPEGMSYAEDIARKYGVTYEMLVKDLQDN